ncbi:MAG TPA: substrate-binding domain-containing protein [Chitinophagales bacterium]|nr:substrate-binding domain-containing protein [Chitinophagales bacterium]
MAIVLLVILLSVVGCKQNSGQGAKKAPTKYSTYVGQLSVVADTGLEAIIKQQEEIFDYMYDSVQTTFSYKNEKEMFADFKAKKATVMILSRKLEQAEINDLKNLDTIYVRELPVAYDAVAMIGGKDFDDSKLDMEVLKKYFNPAATSTDNPKLVFEGRQSSTVNFVVTKLGYKEKVSPNVFALQSAQEVIDYVAANKNVIGFIPYNLISDADDARVKTTLKSIKILSLRAKDSEGKDIRVSANQSDIAVGDYPLIRTVNTVTRYTYEDNLELLMVGFLSREKGAKIFLKAGLMPVKVPERDIIVNESEVTGSK